MALAGFRGIFIPGCLNSHPFANLGFKPLPGGINVQHIPHHPAYPAGSAVYITLKLMKQAFAQVSPAVFIEVRDALLAESRAEIAEKLSVARIERCTFAEEDDIGYVYFVRRPPSLHFENLAAPVAETIAFFSDLGTQVSTADKRPSKLWRNNPVLCSMAATA